MEIKNIFSNLSPLDHRYYLSNRDVHESLGRVLSEEAAVTYQTAVEIALLKHLIPFAITDKKEITRLQQDVEAVGRAVDPAEVYEEEEKTRHNIRALVNVLKRRVPAEVSRLVHVGATSVDILDTSFSLRLKDAVRGTVLPLLIRLEELLIERTAEEADTPQVGRTHGQFAVPITFGFALAEYVSRLGKSIRRMEVKSRNLRGKLAGAVGAYNALLMVTPDPEALEREVLGSLGLEPSEHSTQLVEPEYALELLLEINTAFGVVANLADDLRHLQRSEIGEAREEFKADQVGSSTMPQKRNPWNSEHVKSLWKEFSPRVMTFFMDQISEHQRDLTNSASQRFVSEYVAGFAFAVNRMISVVKSLGVIRERMLLNLAAAGDASLAEAAYVLLALGGDAEAHETVRRATLAAEKEKLPLADILRRDKTAWERIETRLAKVMKADAAEFFSHPERSTGLAGPKAKKLAAAYAALMKETKEALA
ncbi:MAG: adenylosuccinate lyase [Spirochaetales bacterium]|nr:adenylosuccinate lyase [Spirochaetales bacterium]